jgi:hypothetical protein
MVKNVKRRRDEEREEASEGEYSMVARARSTVALVS